MLTDTFERKADIAICMNIDETYNSNLLAGQVVAQCVQCSGRHALPGFPRSSLE